MFLNLGQTGGQHMLFNDVGMIPSMDDEIAFQAIDNESVLEVTVLTDKRTIKLHRGHVMEELENFFMENEFDMRQTQLEVQMILPNGQSEVAIDNGGVTRDALSEYWETFYMKRTAGHQLKVPSLSHTIDGKRWAAAGKILCVGYYYEKYMPTQLASCFLEYAASGDIIPSDVLLNQFLQYLPESERAIAESCLRDYESVDEEELLDFLSDHNVKVKPQKDNIQQLLEQTAHKEMLQVPTFVAECWKGELMNLKPLLPEASSFLDMVIQKPTFKNVWRSLSWEESADPEIKGFLKKVLKEFSSDLLQKFLRFCTGKLC